MAHVERAGNIGRGYYQRIGKTVTERSWLKTFTQDPEFIPLFFYALWIEALV
jgi:hypothetical protein